MKRYIKEHKAVVIAVVLMLMIVVCAFLVKIAFFTNSKNAVYGNRLDKIESVKVVKGQMKKIEDKVTSDEIASDASVSTQGRIINVLITVNDDASLDAAKGLSKKVLEELDDDQKKYFDIQIFIKKDKETNDFPIIGYKHCDKEDFAWTKDRVAE